MMTILTMTTIIQVITIMATTVVTITMVVLTTILLTGTKTIAQQHRRNNSRLYNQLKTSPNDMSSHIHTERINTRNTSVHTYTVRPKDLTIRFEGLKSLLTKLYLANKPLTGKEFTSISVHVLDFMQPKRTA